jgi:hypothetical protein
MDFLGHDLDYQDDIDNYVAKNKELWTYELIPDDWDGIKTLLNFPIVLDP